jgi:hypothetical protein
MTKRTASSINTIFDNVVELIIYIECGGWIIMREEKLKRILR